MTSVQRLIYKTFLMEAAKSSSPVCKIVFCDTNYEKLLLYNIYSFVVQCMLFPVYPSDLIKER